MDKFSAKKAGYRLGPTGEFIIENYNHSRPFSNFFPGIAGKYGIPMWTFYVNRGQCISSFGIKDKDHAILEFLPANQAWERVTTHGFRTFIKVNSKEKPAFYEPFHNGFTNLGYRLSNRMLIKPDQLILEETNLSLGLRVTVKYFNIPNESYAGLARIVTVKNLKQSNRDIEIIDGLPQFIPFGTNNWLLKEMSRTIEAWMLVENMANSAPFFRLAVDPADRPEVVRIEEGNFYLSFTQDKGKTRLIRPIIDPSEVFGAVSDFTCPLNFLKAKFNAPKNFNITSKTPSAFAFLKVNLKKDGEREICSISGYMRSLKDLNASLGRLSAPGYLDKKMAENTQMISALMDEADTASSSREFDLYLRQSYLDNVLRGGWPFTFPCGKTFYLYSRKHGDPERDYNRYLLAPTYFSQGNGSYRDLNQNRRSDIWFNPALKSENVHTLLNLMQLDGFNPLIIKGASFIIKDMAKVEAELKGSCPPEGLKRIVANFKDKEFSPGDLIHFLEDNSIKLKVSYDKFLDAIISACATINHAEHGEGFWSDHWHYNLDLLESYLGVYPEEKDNIIFKDKSFTFFDNAEVVKPRSEKYVLYKGMPRQLHAVGLDHSKRELIHKRKASPNVARSSYGNGEIYETTLLNKLLCLLANKFASLDPFGVGIEMESDKPNWFDALNGLPALFGSSSCETFELKRLAVFLRDAIREYGAGILFVTEEIALFLQDLGELTRLSIKNEIGDYAWWDKTHALKEEYRRKTRCGVSGEEKEIPASSLLEITDLILAKLDTGIEKAKDGKGHFYYGYFIHEVKEYTRLNTNFIHPTAFNQVRVPLFLEAQVHAMRLIQEKETAKTLYQAVKKSALFDKKLKMYKVTAPLSSMPEEIGRCRIFAPGWLENESIWLHMEYKYLLELLKAGLQEEFYADLKNVLIPFQKPGRYGRSILENSSFLVSSAFPDKSMHGNGFVARLSGSTAEMLEIWLKMNLGLKPFYLDNKGKLCLSFSPLLAGWLFNKNGEYSFKFLSKIKITYQNPSKKNTFGKDSAKVCRIAFKDTDGSLIEISSDTINSPYSEKIRSCQIKQINIYLK